MSSRKKKQWRLSHKQPKERLKRPRPTKLHQSQPTKKSKHLYPFQETLLNDVETRLTKSRGILVVSPPGSGKSVMIGALIKKFTDQQKEVWFMVHRKELIAQIEAELREQQVNFDYVVTSTPVKLASRLSQYPKPDLIVTDEAHHSRANSYQVIYSQFPDAKLVGFTATPYRLDGQPLKPTYGEIVVGPATNWLIKENYLAPYRYYSLSMINRRCLKSQAGDYSRRSVSEALMGEEDDTTHKSFGGIVESYRKFADGTQAILYAHTIEYAERYAQLFQQAGIKAVEVDGQTPAKERDRIMDQFRDGKIQILCNVDLVSEGFNVPECETVILLRPTQSLTIYLQQSMRSMRYQPGKTAIIIDHVLNYKEHGLPDQVRDWQTMNQTEPAPREDHFECPHCNRVLTKWKHKTVERNGKRRNQMLCPYCQYVKDENPLDPPVQEPNDRNYEMEQEAAELSEVKQTKETTLEELAVMPLENQDLYTTIQIEVARYEVDSGNYHVKSPVFKGLYDFAEHHYDNWPDYQVIVSQINRIVNDFSDYMNGQVEPKKLIEQVQDYRIKQAISQMDYLTAWRFYRSMLIDAVGPERYVEFSETGVLHKIVGKKSSQLAKDLAWRRQRWSESEMDSYFVEQATVLSRQYHSLTSDYNYQNTSKYLYNRMKYVFDQQLEQQVEKRKRKCTYRR